MSDIKLHIGSAGVRTTGWTNLDYVDSGWKAKDLSINVDINCNVVNGIPLENDTVSAIYSSHFLEHLNWHEGLNFIQECYRICKAGAVIRFVVPDADYFVKKFIERDLEFFKDPNRCYNNWMGNLTDTFLWNIIGANATKERHFGRHSMMYNFENLSARLNYFKFRDIKRCGYNVGNENFLPEDKFFEDNKFCRSIETSLFIEATK